MRDKELRERFDGINARFEAMDRRFEQVLQALSDTRHALALEIITTREELNARIDAVDEKLETFRDETHTNFDHVFGRFGRLETEYYSI